MNFVLPWFPLGVVHKKLFLLRSMHLYLSSWFSPPLTYVASQIFPLNHDSFLPNPKFFFTSFLLNKNFFLFQSSSLFIPQLSQGQLLRFDMKTLFFLFLWFLNKFHFLGQIFPYIFFDGFVLSVGLLGVPTNWPLKIGSVSKFGRTILLTNRC